MAFCYAAVRCSWSPCLPLLPLCCVTRLCYDCDPEFDDKKLDEAFDFNSYPLLEKEVDSAVDLQVESAKFEPTIEE